VDKSFSGKAGKRPNNFLKPNVKQDLKVGADRQGGGLLFLLSPSVKKGWVETL